MFFEDFLDAAKDYAELGWAVQEQIDNLLDAGLEPGDLNENAVRMIERWAENLPADINTDVLLCSIEDYRALEEDELLL